MRFRHLFLFCFFAFMASSTMLQAQDTTIVQTLTFDSTARAGTWMFPADTGQTYRKVIMQYRMRCHNAAVGNGFTGCYEWDYSCNTLIRDSSQTDSARLNHPTHSVAGFSGPSYDYLFTPTYDFVADSQHQIVYNSVISESAYPVGTGSISGNAPFESSIPDTKSQYLWHASELSTAGLTAGPITGLRMNLNTLGANLRYLRVRMRPTTATALFEIVPDDAQWQDVYFIDTQFPGTGPQTLPFYNNFNWNGTDNVLVEYSYSLNAPGSDYVVQSDAPTFPSGAVSPSHDGYLNLDGQDDAIVWDPGANQTLAGMTVEFWTRVKTTGQAQYSSFVNTGSTGQDFQIDLNNNDEIRLLGDNKTLTLGATTGEWQHVAVSIDATNLKTIIYLDGVAIDSAQGGNQDNVLQDITIGENRGGTTRVDADMDEIRVWDVVRSGSQIQSGMLKRLTGNEAGLYMYYRMDDGQANPATDATSNGRNGVKSGNIAQKWYSGGAIFKGLEVVNERPRMTFLRGTYNMTNTTIAVLDSIARDPQTVTSYGLSGTDLVTLGQYNSWASGWQYVYDAMGNVQDSVLATADSTLLISNFDYFRKAMMDLEIMSFVTPYGNGLDLGPNGVMWEFDVTDFTPVLHGPIYMYMTRGGQNQEEMDIRFLLIEGTPPREVKTLRNIWPVSGTLGESTSYANFASDNVQEPRDVILPADEAAWNIRSMVTGHGQQGEFIPRMHYVNIDGGPEEWTWSVWKECSEVPVFPQGGTWLYDRAGWCPGDPTDLQLFPLDSFAGPGDTVNIDYGIATISNPGDTRYLTSHLLVGYGAPSFALDAAIVSVKVPSDQSEFARYNPACSQPVITIRNEGSTPLTSLEFTYQVRGGTSVTYSWTGNLAFLETEEVILPLNAQSFWSNATANVFEVAVSQPNGSADPHADNDAYASSYEPWADYMGGLKIVWRTNNDGNQTTWKVYDDQGNVVAQNNIFIGPNTNFSDDLNLPAGCYKLRFDDTGDNGLYYWATPASGTGYARFLEYTSIRENFEPEFGGFFEHHFWTDGLVNGEEITTPELIRVWPNPSADRFHVRLEGFAAEFGVVEVFDITGRKVWSNDLSAMGNHIFAEEVIDLSGQAAGTYVLKVRVGETVRTRSLQKL